MPARVCPAAVIGADGFIGATLTSALAAHSIPFERIIRSTPIFRDDSLISSLRLARVIFYLATSVNPALAERYPDRVAADHDLFGALIAALRASGHRPVVVLASTAGAMYDENVRPPYSERDPVRPTSVYGRAKLQMENTLFGARDAVEPIVLRIASAYGPGQRTGTGQGVIGHWLEAAAVGKPLQVFGNQSVRRDYVHVADVADAFIRVYYSVGSNSSRLPAVLNLASGCPVSLAELLEIVRGVVGTGIAVERVPGRSFDRGDVWFDVSLISGALGWRPRISLEEGVRGTWRTLRLKLAEANPAQQSGTG